MNRIGYFVFRFFTISALLLICLSACQKKEEAPASETQEPATATAPAPQEPAPETKEPPTATASAPEPTAIEFHVWDMLLRRGTEMNGYGMYTYVLFGRHITGSGDLNPKIADLYKALLAAIIRSTNTVSEGQGEPQDTNIFYIPTLDRQKPMTLNNYNSHLAMGYISSLASMLRRDPSLVSRFTLRPGPFLISTLQPLGTKKTGDIALLYADLSDSHPAAMQEVVNTYKNQIIEKRLHKIERFNPLRLALLNLILDTNDNLKILEAEAAAWQ